MTYSIDFLPEVERDVQDAYNWYEEQLTGLGEDFLLSTDAAINSIQRNPLQNEVSYRQVRKLKTKRFPFYLTSRISDSNSHSPFVAPPSNLESP